MSAAHWSEVKALFSAALELPSEDRAAYLALEAGGNPALLEEVQSLLASHEQPGDFLETVTHDFRSRAFEGSSAARGRIGERIGAYRIVGVLGSGGMGDVFKAVRDDDQYRAEVAIKLMRADVRSHLTERRFKTERQILAGLDHRNIARLLDGGTTDGGTPYVVMELVSGQPIDADCDARALGVRDRVQLFLQVCAAVSYAHQHLVVHRDLKPNNILVTADGSVKLLDFGIAKLLEAEADTAVAAANATATTLRAMTLEYASPEQVSGASVTTVSDVYSLGVVLYHLLTGKSPYRVRTNDAARMAEILSDSTPTRPSQVERKVDADLDNILLMALRKEPQRRYASVEQLANDLRNYLAGMPVRARGNSWRYRAGKFVRRRKVELAAGFLVAAALFGALVFSIREARIADRERLVAEQHFASVRKLANTMLFQLHDEMARVSGSIKTRELLVKTSLEYLDELYQASSADLALQEELAVAYKKVGDIQGNELEANIGDYQGALRSYARSVALLEPLVAAEPANLRTAKLLAGTYVQQAGLMLVAGNASDAVVAIEKGAKLSEAIAPAIADRGERTLHLASAYTVQANILYAVGRSAEGIVVLEKLIALCEAFHRDEPRNPSSVPLVTAAYNNAANHIDPRLSEPRNFDRALAMLRRALVMNEELAASNPGKPAAQFGLARTRYNLGRMMYARGDQAGSLELHRQAAEVLAAAAQDPDDVRALYTSALMSSGYGQALFSAGRIAEARQVLTGCEAVLKRLVEQGGTLRIIYARGHNNVRLGILYESLAHKDPSLWREARNALAEGVSGLQQVTARVEIEPIDRRALDAGIAALARVDEALAQ